MFTKEKDWIWGKIQSLPIMNQMTVLDIGSASLYYRTEKQPYIGELFKLLTQQNNSTIRTLDIDSNSGANYTYDISAANVPNIGTFDLVLVNNLLEHVYVDRLPTAISNIKNIASKYLIVTGPSFYIWHFQPIDNGLRATPDELAQLFKPDFKVLFSDEWEDENYAEPYKSDSKYPKPWVSGVVLEKLT